MSNSNHGIYWKVMQLEKNPYILAEPDSGIDANVVGGVQEPRVQLGLIDTEQSLGS